MPLPHNWTLNEVLALSLVPRIKSVDLRNLVERYVSLEALLQAAPSEIQKARITSDTLFTSTTSASLLEAANKQQELCNNHTVRVVSFWDEDYPQLLK